MEATREFYRRSNPAERVTVGHVDSATVETITADGLHLWSTRSQFIAEFYPVEESSEEQAFSDLPPAYFHSVMFPDPFCDLQRHLPRLVKSGFVARRVRVIREASIILGVPKP